MQLKVTWYKVHAQPQQHGGAMLVTFTSTDSLLLVSGNAQRAADR